MNLQLCDTAPNFTHQSSTPEIGFYDWAGNNCILEKTNTTDKKSFFSCFLIGEATLLIPCGDLLLEKGHNITGIISSEVSVKRWCLTNKIPYIQPKDNFIEILSQQPFDYLFSIVNPYILTKETLGLPCQGAINFHNAPLPKYAGVHATSWALINREKTHGVTWHRMSDRVDSGEILKQVTVDIADNETTLTLNGKCYEAAIHSFAALIDELASNKVEAVKQNLNERTYFSASKKPQAIGLLDFNCCAYELNALVRALNFGSHANPIAQAKLEIENDIFVISKLEVLDDLADLPPGTITAIEPDVLKVSTSSYEVALSQIKTINGQALSIPDLVQKFGLHIGYQFKAIEPEIAKCLEKFASSIAKHETFWVERLSSLDLITIPYARKVSLLKQPQYAIAKMAVPDQIISFLDEHHPTWNPGDFLFAAFVGYLARISGIESFDIGYSDVELEQALMEIKGLFASTVPSRLTINYEQSFEAIFAAVQEQVGLTKLHLTYARDAVLRYPQLASLRELGDRQIFPVMIERVESLDKSQAKPSHELTFIIPGNGKECGWLYDTEVLDSDSIARMTEQFNIFLQGIVQASSQRLDCLPLVSKKELHTMLVEWNNTQADHAKDKCVHQLFESQVEQTPDAVAVVFAQQSLTYKELNARANQLAHYLLSLGVGTEILVGICVERSLEFVVGILGILKAGGAYLPIDPDYPAERLTFMLEDASVSVLLTQSHLVNSLSQQQAHVICLDTQWQVIAQYSSSNLATVVSVENLAYTIYTSGSTGKPKGVAIEHGGLLNLIFWHQKAFAVSSSDRATQIAGLGFDACVWEIWPYLTAGASLYLPDDETRIQAEKLIDWLKAQAITICFLPTPLAEKILTLDWPQDVALRILLTGGDKLHHYPSDSHPFVVVNNYGPTENTVVTTSAIVPAQAQADVVPVIGTPIANTKVYVLDTRLNCVPIGVPGELYIGGAGLARGYLNRPDLTAEKFITVTGERLYKTGDLVRYLPDGNIEYIGRIDHQVKIRGFRIELGEIEAVLSQHPEVQAATVIAREDLPGDKRLVAYVVPNTEPTPTDRMLRQFLQQQLPDYMVPSHVVILEALPLTPNGKVDRKALPVPSNVNLQNTFVPPRDSVELQLTQIWENILGISPISVLDNFFDLGAHSLSSVSLMTQIQQRFGQSFPLSTLFQNPTIEKLATIIRQQGSASSGSPVVAIQPSGSKKPFFCVHPVGGNVLSYLHLARYLGEDQPFYGLQAQGLDGQQAPMTSIEEMAAAYIKAMRAVQAEGPYLLGGWSLGGTIAFEMAVQLQQQGHQVALLALFDSPAPHIEQNSQNNLDDTALLNNFAHNIGVYFGKNLVEGDDEFKKLTFDQQLHHILEQAKIAGLIPSETGIEYLRPLVEVYKANVTAVQNYVPQIYTNQVILFKASAGLSSDCPGSALGWEQFTVKPVELYTVPGEHLTIMSNPHVQDLAEKLTRCLQEAQVVKPDLLISSKRFLSSNWLSELTNRTVA